MGCKVKYDERHNVTEVYANNGAVSQLWSDLKDTGLSNNEAYNYYIVSRTDEFTDYLDNRKFNRDINGEPTLETIGSIYDELEINKVLDDLNTTPPQDIKLNNKVKSFLETVGVDYKSVEDIKDSNGSPLKAVGKADMLTKIVEVSEGKADITTLPEEAAHFFVEILRTQNPKLYNQMYKNISKYKVYDKVVQEYGELDSYTGKEHKLRDEAIAKLIANELVNQHLENENIEALPTFRRWFAKLLKAMGQIFDGTFSDPYKAAAYKMLNAETQAYKDAASNITSTETYLQSDSSSAPNSQKKSTQASVVDKIMKTHNSTFIDESKLKGWIQEYLPTDYKLLRTLMEQDEDGTFARYVIDQGPGKPPLMITNRTTDEGTRQFIKKVGKFRAQEINKSDRAAHARKHGTNLHGAAQMLIEKLAQKNKSLDVVQTMDTPFKGNHKEIQKKAGLTRADLYNNFKLGVSSILDTIEQTQNEISSTESAKILTEVRLYDPNMGGGTGTAGTIDLLVVYSDGTVGIFDWKFMTPQYQYTEGLGALRRLVDNPWAIKMDGWNMQIGAYKKMLNKVHGIKNKDVRQSRIIPAHVEYKVKDHTKKDYRRSDTIDVLNMSSKQNPFLAQISVGKELKTFSGINNLLKALYTKRDKLFNQMKNVRGQNETYAQLKSRYLATLNSIQEVTVNENILHIVNTNDDHIVNIAENIHKNNPSEKGFLDYNGLLNMLEDLLLFENLNKDVVEYLSDIEQRNPDQADILRSALADGASQVHQSIQLIRNKMYERLMDEASVIGEDITEDSLRLGFWARNLEQMDEIENPIFRVAMDEITKSFNNSKRDTDKIFKDVQKKQAALEKWAEKNGLNLTQAFQKLIKDRKVKGEIKSRSLVPKFSEKFYKEMENQTEAKSTAWFKKHFKLKDNWKETYDRKLRNKQIELQYIKNDKIRNGALKQFQKFNNFIVNDEAWSSPYNRWQYLELKNPKDFYSKSYAELQLPKNKPLLDFYEMYHDYNKQFQEITGKGQLKPGFIANRRDGIMESVINNGFNASKFFDAISAPFLTHANEQTMGVRDNNGLVDQIPLPFTEPLTNSKGEVDASLKSIELGKSLYALSLGVYNYKYMSEIEAKVMALKDFLINQSQETDTTYFGNIKEDEAGEATASNVSPETLSTFDRFVKYYVYGQRMQDKRNLVGGVDLVKVIPALQSIYSLKVLSFAVVPGIAARAVGGINMYIEGIDGVNYTKEQLREANKAYVKNYKEVVEFSEFFDPYQSGNSWHQMRDLSMKKAAKFLNVDNAYYPLRAADENMDTMITIAMAQNHGIDKNGVIQRMEDLVLENKDAVSLWDAFLKNGKIDDMNLNDNAFVDFRRRIKEVAGKIKGEMSDENIVAAQTQLMGRLLLQFRGWMPGLVAERFKTIKYNRILKTLEEGRYIGFLKGANYGKTMLEDEIKFTTIASNALKRTSSIVQELLFLKKFITNPNEKARLEEEGKWTDRMDAEYNRKVAALTREFEAWRRNNPAAKNITNVNDFLRLRQRSVRRTLAEMRSIIMVYAALLAMGLGEDDNEIRNRSWTTRKLNMALNRIAMELGFMLNPMEFTKFLRGGIPVVGLLVDAQNLLKNSLDETFDTLGIWAESPNDSTPPLYYSTKFVPGAHQLGRVFEFWGKPINI
tara:strand:- start:2315 stop:7276 length:4962 start_codon:yes stop_codon:yes gene_type:complete